MDKIRDLLKQLGASDDLSKALLSELHNYRQRVKKDLNEEFKSRLTKAKQICLEEFENEKRNLSRKVEVFLEARVNTIDREAQRHAAIGESEASKTLKDLKSLLEGVPIDGSSKDIQAAKEETKRLRVRLNQVMEEKDAIKEQAVRSNEIAMKALERNKILETKTSGGKPRNTVSEGKAQGAKKTTRLESLRKTSDKPRTMRKVLTESQVAAAPSKPAQQGNSDVMHIASELDSAPAYLGS